MSDHDYQRRAISLATGAHHQVKLPPRVMRGRVTGLLFESNKTFLLPNALKGMRMLANFYWAHPGLKLLVTGHTDTVGGDWANLPLSEERAAAVAAFLADDIDAWLKHYKGTPGSARWGTREDQHLLSALPVGGPAYYAGPIHGRLDAATQDAARRFQAGHGLTVDGIPGPQTRRALITEYMATDGTSVPAGTEIQTHGCGEFHPVVLTADNIDEPANRRVEVFFFEGSVEPAPRPKCPHPGCPEYPQWVARTTLTIDAGVELATGDLTVEVVDQHMRPVAGAEVNLVARNMKSATEVDGLARFSNIPIGPHAVMVFARGFHDGKASAVVVGGLETRVLVALAGNATLTVVVMDDKSEPIPMVNVTVSDAEGRIAGVAMAAAGKALITNLAPGQYTVTARQPGFETSSMPTSVDRDSHALLVLRRKSTPGPDIVE